MFHFLGRVYSQENFYEINHVPEIRIEFQEKNWKHILDSLFINYGDEGRLVGDIEIDGYKIRKVGIRYKGFSSFSSDGRKNPFNIDLNYSLNNQNYKGYTKLKLSNVIHDPSFVREVLSYEIARKYMPASLANFANVYINDTLIGLYTNIESVDNNFIAKHFTSNDNSFFKGSPQQLQFPFGQNSNLAYTHGSDSSGYIPYYKLESDEFGWSDLFKLIDILNNDTSNIETILNVDRALWMHAFNYLLVNLDSYIGYSQNYYLYKDDNGRFNTIPWDLNMSFGSFRNSDATALNLSIPKAKQLNPLQLLFTNSFTPRPLIKNLVSNTTNRKMYIAHMRTIINENFRNNEYYIVGQQLQSLIDSYVQNDTNKFYSYDDFKRNVDSTTGPTSDLYPGIRDFMEARMAYLDTFPGFNGAPEITDIQHSPDVPEKDNEVWVTTRIIKSNNAFLAYRQSRNALFIKTNFYDDGNHNDGNAGDSTFGAKIISNGHNIEYYIYAENDSAGIFSPERAEFEYYTIQPKIKQGDIVINEFNTDWIEIFNNTGEDYNLSALFLSDDDTDFTKWKFPDTMLASKNYFVVWTDESNNPSNVSTNFNLSEEGGKLFLSNNTQNIINTITYGEEEPGKTLGRYPNGTGSYVYMLPTFSYCNNPGSAEDADLTLYPNPSTEKIRIEFKNEGFPFTIWIINAIGNPVMYNEIESSQTSTSFISKSFDVSNFGNGVYIVKLICNNKIMTKRFIIVN